MGLDSLVADIKHIVWPRKSPDVILTILETTEAELDTNAFVDLPQSLIRYLTGYTLDFFYKLDFSYVTWFEISIWETAR